MFKHIKQDFPAGVVVFLVALPLCLGVALASGAPMLSGIISGVVGGVIVGFLSKSHVSVSGPAAGLTTVVLTAISQLGSFEAFLVAVVIAGFVQVLAGYARGGFIANYVPANVIKGLLAAIGIILILKQIPHAVGYDGVAEEDFAFAQSDKQNTFSELFNMLNYFSYGTIFISVISLLILIFWDKIKYLKAIPASLVVVLIGVVLNAVFYHLIPFLYVHQHHLVHIPKISSVNDLFQFPDFIHIANKQVWIVGLTIAAIASLETLLNLEAVQNLDPHKRKASPNRELIAQGFGNMVSGLIGGIPITSVIVRSSVNINAGGQTKMAAILHGLILFASVLLISSFLNLIPLASLAAILIHTGYKLAKVEIFIEKYKKGWNQFIPFIVTIIAILFSDLLIGISIGLGISILFLLKNSFTNPFNVKKEKVSVKETIKIDLPNQVSFLNKASIKNTLWKLPKNSSVILNAKNTNYMDNDIVELLRNFKNTVAVENNIQLNIIGLEGFEDLHDQIEFYNVIDKETQENLTPDQVINILKKGNKRFANGEIYEKFYDQQINATSNSQSPIAVIVTCIDSRTSPEIIFDLGLGDIISIRIAGNIINKEIIGSIEFACSKIGTKAIVVVGHSNCGAVTYAINNKGEGNVASITDKIEKAIVSCNCKREEITQNQEDLNKVINANVHNSIAEILTESDYLQGKVNDGTIKIVPAFYDTATGYVLFEN